MEITEEQKGLIQKMADEGADLGQIQKRLADELGITLTYLETRMLISDLEIVFPEPEEEEEEEVEDAEPDLIGTDSSGDTSEAEASPGDPGKGSVTVTLSEVAPPGMIANGSVTFSDGETAQWYLDETGRLGLDAANPDYRPSESDIVAFQNELKRFA